MQVSGFRCEQMGAVRSGSARFGARAMSTSTGLVDRCQAPGLQEGHHGTSL